ncbi:MAG: AAA family ATPase [Nitrospira sp.]|nr:AAA family ATPase [Nitrospira sp.]
MTQEELQELISEVQQHQSELDDMEVKSAHKGTPQRLYEPISAFANSTSGGVILFGLNEERNYEIVGVGDSQRLQEEVSQLAAAEMTPPLRPSFTVVEIEGKAVVAVEIPGLTAEQKPCFYKHAGMHKGAYIRVGNTNRQMTDYEIFGYVSARTQPTFDEETIKEASLDDLNKDRLQNYIAALKKSRPQATYLNKSFEQILAQLRIVKDVNGILIPTLAGLLMFGDYPQAFESQLVITFLQYYGSTETEKTPRGERFLDNRKFEGPIPEMVESAINYVMSSIRKSSLIEGLYRRDIPEYPEEAIREAVVNAVAHRDYSHFVRGSYIQIRLFADRIEIQSPGGLYGNVTEDTIEEEQSTRNRVLMKFMEDLHLVENRGSGTRTMIDAMRKANLEPPKLKDKRTSFWVTFRSHTLMRPESIAWLNQFASLPINDHQRLAMVYLRNNEQITNSDYQRLNHVDSVIANRELSGLIQIGLIKQHKTKRWAFYTLNVPIEKELILPPQTDEEKVLAYVQKQGSISRLQCRILLNISDIQAKYFLQKMHRAKKLRLMGRGRGAKYVLP